MLTRYGLLDMMADVMRTHEEQERQAITDYRFAVCEQHGEELDWEYAAQEWWRDHFGSWKRARWLAAIDEALRIDCALATGLIAG